jgi:NDP-sugar pyrophosphorylase family protein
MQCVILAGGLAKRLGPLTERIPKALVPVAGRPFADYQLSWLASQGVTDVVLAIGHLGDAIRAFVGAGERWGLCVDYSDEGDVLRGTAGALRLAYGRKLLEPAFGVLYGDSYLTAPIGAAWDEFTATNPAVLMTVYRNDGRWDTSNVEFSRGIVLRYQKGATAAGMHHIDYGFSIIDRDAVMPLIEPAAAVDLGDVYQRLSADGKVRGLEVCERFYEIGSPAGLAELEKLLKEPSRG